MKVEITARGDVIRAILKHYGVNPEAKDKKLIRFCLESFIQSSFILRLQEEKGG